MSITDLKPWFHQHLLRDILPRWLESAVDPSGFLHPGLDRRWQRTGRSEATLVSQCRLIYNFAVGWRQAGIGAYREAVRLGASFLVAHFRDRELGGWHFAVDAQGDPVDRRRDAYGYAFCIFGLAHASAALADRSLHQLALDTLDELFARFADDRGGLVPQLDPDFTNPPPGRSQNPLMHLFESHLALIEHHGPDPMVMASANRLADFVHRIAGHSALGILPEVYDDRWQPLPREKGGRMDLGHAMEWAFLLSRGVELGLSAEWLPVASALLQRGLEVGQDPAGGLHSNQAPEGDILPGRKGWWQQAEAIRTLVHFAQTHDRADLEPLVCLNLDFARRTFIDPEFGGWYNHELGPDATDAERRKGDVWKVDYHVVGMCDEALRVM
ncbi:MAG: AGE family epimerase/isomerase [Armatimonadetes bacterium]|nr:AGE family epimerase/isomerase [Armatimonadota bacterium]MDI9586974.1 AGE family epimerase/isomerase [Acidobacteriota bacterium]